MFHYLSFSDRSNAKWGSKLKMKKKKKSGRAGEEGGEGGEDSRYPHVWNVLIRVIFCNRTLIPIHSEKYVFLLGCAIQPEDFNTTTGVPKKKTIIINSLRRL